MIILVSENVNQKHLRKTIKEHNSIIQEPGSVYFAHATNLNDSAKNIADSIIFHLTDDSFSLDKFDELGCGGIVKNTCSRTGVMRLIKQHIKRPIR